MGLLSLEALASIKRAVSSLIREDVRLGAAQRATRGLSHRFHLLSEVNPRLVKGESSGIVDCPGLVTDSEQRFE